MEYLQNLDWATVAGYLVGPACILAVSLAAGITLNGMLNQRIQTRMKTIEPNIKGVFYNAMRGVPISLCLVIGLYWIVNTSSHLPAGVVSLFSYILFTVIVFSITRVIERTLSGFLKLKLASSGDASQSSLLETIFRVFVYASGVLMILQYYGISIAPIITAMGVGGMAVAFGLQETVANIFSGLHLVLTKQLKIRDYVKLASGEEGYVTDINLRYTTITPANEGSVIVIPNKNIAGATTINYSRPRDDIVVAIPIGVSYNSDLEQVERVTVEVARNVMMQVDNYQPMYNEDGIDKNPLSPVVRYSAFGDSSIDFSAILHASNFSNQFLMKHEFIKQITTRYREEGIDIPFPIRTVINSDHG